MEIDERYMRRALQLARLGAGAASPNPMVGAVIVHRQRIIGEGYHRQWGGPHAEVNAVDAVVHKELLADSTIYVTLEPCAHYGKTPPCAELLVRCRVPRVVVGIVDPFARVSGRGVQMLRDAGAEVVTGVLEDECRALNHRFLTAHTRRRPFVLLKWAQSSDGFIAAHGGMPVALSSSMTQVWMHRERSRCDAIVVGAGTVLADNPSLTVRRWPAVRQPLRVVIDGRLSMPADRTVLTDGQPTIVYNNSESSVDGAVERVKMDLSSPAAWLAHLYARGITSVMVEGGASVLRQMIESGLWDQARIETAHAVQLHSGICAPSWPQGSMIREERHGQNAITYIENSAEH